MVLVLVLIVLILAKFCINKGLAKDRLLDYIISEGGTGLGASRLQARALITRHMVVFTLVFCRCSR